VVDFISAWSIWETAAGQSAAYNLLNTTQPKTGATNYNSVGVKNYTSYQQGIEATVETIRNGLYTPLDQALTNNESARLANINDGGIRHSLDTWSGGAGYNAIIVAVARNIQSGSDRRDKDTFEGMGGNITPGQPNAIASTTASLSLSPDAQIGDILGTLDAILALANPFNVPNPPMTNVFGSEFVDPMAWTTEVGLNFGENISALLLRLILIVLGVIVAWKGMKHVIKIDPIGSAVTGGNLTRQADQARGIS